MTLRAGAYLAAVVVAPFAALALGDPAPVLVALPVALCLVVGLMAPLEMEPSLRIVPGRDRSVEGMAVPYRVEVEATASMAYVTLDLPGAAVISEARGARVVGSNGLVIVLTGGGGAADLDVTFGRWGNHAITGQVAVQGPLRLTDQTAVGGESQSVVVLPDTATVRRLVEPLMTNMHAGDLVSVGRGAGIEPAEVRVWQPSDPPRAINWRASARSERLWATDRHADRSGDLILVVDSVTGAAAEIEETVGEVVRLVASLVEAYGRGRHRLGLVSLSGYTRWFGLDSGALHEHRLLEAVMRTQAVVDPVWMAVDRVFERTVHRPTLVIFVSPLVSDGIRERALRLAAGGIDVGMVAVDPSPWIVPPGDRLRASAHRIWRLERRRSLDVLAASGVGIGEWRPDRSLADVMEEMGEWRRRRRVRI